MRYFHFGLGQQFSTSRWDRSVCDNQIFFLKLHTFGREESYQVFSPGNFNALLQTSWPLLGWMMGFCLPRMQYDFPSSCSGSCGAPLRSPPLPREDHPLIVPHPCPSIALKGRNFTPKVTLAGTFSVLENKGSVLSLKLRYLWGYVSVSELLRD